MRHDHQSLDGFEKGIGAKIEIDLETVHENIANVIWRASVLRPLPNYCLEITPK